MKKHDIYNISMIVDQKLHEVKYTSDLEKQNCIKFINAISTHFQEYYCSEKQNEELEKTEHYQAMRRSNMDGDVLYR